MYKQDLVIVKSGSAECNPIDPFTVPFFTQD